MIFLHFRVPLGLSIPFDPECGPLLTKLVSAPAFNVNTDVNMHIFYIIMQHGYHWRSY